MNFKSVFFLLSISLTCLVTAPSAYAHNGGESHGGDSVVCFDRPYFVKKDVVDPNAGIVGRPQFKDFWEYSQLLHYTLMNPDVDLSPSYTYKDLVDFVLTKLKDSDPQVYNKLFPLLNDFDRYFKFTNNAVLEEVNDSDSEIKPDPSIFCYEIQLAIFKESRLPGASYSLINKRIFDLMSERDKAGLIFHELFWLLINKESQNKNISQYVRHYTYLAFTKEFLFEEFSHYFYLKNILQSGIHHYLQWPSRAYVMNKGKYEVKLPVNYGPSTALDLRMVELKFFGESRFHLPKDILDIHEYVWIEPRKGDDYRVCLDLEQDALKQYGPCP